MLALPKSLKLEEYKMRIIISKEKKRIEEEERGMNGYKQANDMIVGVAGNMEPSTGIDKSRVPALEDVVGVRKPAS